MNEHIIVGTAGHVDHGKTMLTKALTGTDTDRLPEEKKRGMTIVPGFVPLDLKSGRRLGLIDVPGHERFVKNMLAGVAGIDMALLVVAADDGVMPQTVEHLNILHLLGVKKGVVAITKSDLVDEEWLEMIREQVGELLAPTLLKDAPIVAVSAQTGEHIDDLKDTLDQVSATVELRQSTGQCRLPIDRAFTKQGFGTVVTGTLWSGTVENGKRLELLPAPADGEVRVRGVQVHDAPVEKAYAGQRTALNLAGPGAEGARPGCWVAEPGLLRESFRLDVELHLLPDAPALHHQSRVRIFHGTAEVLGRVRFLDMDVLEPGDDCLCQLLLEDPLPPLRGDRLILRSFSPVVTVAGATVLDATPPRYRRGEPEGLDALQRKASLDVNDALYQLLESNKGMMSLKELAKTAQLPESETAPALRELEENGRVRHIGPEGAAQYFSAFFASLWERKLIETLDDYHRRYPLRKGMPTGEVRQRAFENLNTKQAAAMLELYAAQGIVTISGAVVAKGDFPYLPTPKQQSALDSIEDAYRQGRFMPPDWPILMESLHISPGDAAEYFTWLTDHGRIVKAGELLFAPEALQDAQALLRGFCAGSRSHSGTHSESAAKDAAAPQGVTPADGTATVAPQGATPAAATASPKGTIPATATASPQGTTPASATAAAPQGATPAAATAATAPLDVSSYSTFTMADARDLFGSSRKYAQAILEYLDARKITLREGDVRRFLR
ncbi:MAG: selenocysteine-specific translation elongation factor [Lachnospiraceae bacterium]|jgi:selenocysteine-specific elongation factor|nr:selenocysteine-specific translation elongation factor [Lachnospiraceae bacterium]